METITDTEQDLAEQPEGGRPIIWTPENKDKQPQQLIAEVLGYDSIDTSFGERPIVLLRELETGGVYSRLIGGAVLERLFSSKKPLPGETVRLTFEGQETSRSGRFAGKSYNNWSLEVQRPPRILDWRKLAMGEVELVEFEPTAKQLEAPKPVEASVPEADVVINTAGLPAPAEEDEDVPF